MSDLWLWHLFWVTETAVWNGFINQELHLFLVIQWKEHKQIDESEEDYQTLSFGKNLNGKKKKNSFKSYINGQGKLTQDR